MEPFTVEMSHWESPQMKVPLSQSLLRGAVAHFGSFLHAEHKRYKVSDMHRLCPVHFLAYSHYQSYQLASEALEAKGHQECWSGAYWLSLLLILCNSIQTQDKPGCLAAWDFCETMGINETHHVVFVGDISTTKRCLSSIGSIRFYPLCEPNFFLVPTIPTIPTRTRMHQASDW